MIRVLGLVLASSLILLGQDISGTIGGTISDPAGATIPNAKVTVKNVERNQVVRTVTTDETGTYSAPIIPVGTYSVRVEANGFKTENRTGIVLNVNDNLKINFTLQVGAITETVEVQESSVAVELGNPASATVINGQQVRELSLSTRNYEQLVALMPGVTKNTTDELYIGNSSPAGTAAALPFYINGTRNSANNWTVDGADNVDRGGNLTLMTFPSVDSIAQFKVERSLYTADTGRAGGAQISVVTKSGTSQIHGGLYEFFRNDALSANNWINNANKVGMVDSANKFNDCTKNFTPTCSAKVPPLRWNDFGFTLGGPVSLFGYNKEKNKTFFFYSQEHRRIITYTTFNATVPTADMLNGNFSQPVCLSNDNPCTEVGTSIPANRINPNAAAYIKDIFSKMPLSAVNSVAATSGFYSQRNIFNSDQYIGRIDHNFSERFQVWGKFEVDQIPTTEPGGLFTSSPLPNSATTQTNSPGRSFVVHAVNTISPTLFNDVGFNFSKSEIHSVPIGLTAKSNATDINPIEPFANPWQVVPTVTFTGGSSVVGFGAYNEYNKNYNFYDNLTWSKGRHTLKFGWSTNRYNKRENNISSAGSIQGAFGFTNANAPAGTNSFQQSWANFLLGNVATFSQASQDIMANIWAWQHEAYAQDDFKVRPNLTLYLGVRWSMFGQPTDSGGILTNFDPTRYSAANAAQINPTNGNVAAGSPANWRTNGIIVGGAGSPYGDHVGEQSYKNFAPRVGLAWDPFGTGKTSIRAGYGIYYDSALFGNFELNSGTNPPFVNSVTIPNVNFSNVNAGTGTSSNASNTPISLRATQTSSLTPYYQQWSFNIQQTLAKGMVLEAGYVGSKGTHLIGIVDVNEAMPGAALAAGLKSGTGTVFTSTDTPRINAVRPYQGFNAINTILPAFDSNYHSLQVSLRKAFRSAGQFNFSYTYGKVLTDAGTDRSSAPQNSYNWHDGEYGPGPGDITHVVSFNYIYQLPFFHNSRGIVGAALHGWQLAGLGAVQSGMAYTITTGGVDPAGLGNLGTSAASGRPDMVCNPNVDAPHQYGATNEALWFNPACFANVPSGVVRPGNAGRGVLRGPGFVNLDMTLSKNFNLAADGRVKLQIRLETFNTFNLVNPSGFTSLSITGNNFGQITSFRAPRRAQLAAKIDF